MARNVANKSLADEMKIYKIANAEFYKLVCQSNLLVYKMSWILSISPLSFPPRNKKTEPTTKNKTKMNRESDVREEGPGIRLVGIRQMGK